MQQTKIILVTLLFFVFTSCSNNKLEEKGFSVNSSQAISGNEAENVEGINKDSLKLATLPSNVLITGVLSTIMFLT